MNAAKKTTCLPPIALRRARVLILGSFPSETSLRAREYYAHPRNQFWTIIAELFGIARDMPYRQRCRKLASRGVALWDVLQTCERMGSLDSNIRAAEANDLAAFCRAHQHIHKMFCNGGAAMAHAKKFAPQVTEELQAVRLPSTSPAHAAVSLAEKIAQWTAVRDALS